MKKPKPINHPGDNGKMDIIPIFLLLADRIERLWIVYSALFRFQVWIVVVADKEKDRKKRDHDRITQDRNLRLRLALKTNLLRRKKKGTSKKSSNKNE